MVLHGKYSSTTLIKNYFLMAYIRAKKGLGQHFLIDNNIAEKIVNSLHANEADTVVEIGPGTGVLTKFLLKKNFSGFCAVEIDEESVAFLKKNFPEVSDKLILADFMKLNFSETFKGTTAIIGNLPYFISSQIFFKILENRFQVNEAICMIQKEVAERISAPGSRTYGILSVLLQAWYKIEYLFTVHEHVFSPPPKVKSGVIRLVRNNVMKLECDEKLFFQVVKTAFNQRRKTLRNSLKSMISGEAVAVPLFDLRPERLSVDDFVILTNLIEKFNNSNHANCI